MLWLGIWAVWTLLALMSAGQSALILTYRGQHIMWAPLVLGHLADWYTCAIFTPPLLWLARRFPLEQGVWKKHLPIHAVASIVAVFLKYAIYVPLARVIYRQNASIQQALATNILTESMFIWATIGAIHTIEFYRRYRERESLAHRLSAELSRAQLDALRAQIHPHFLFNTLNAIATLVHSDPDAADEMISRLSGLLRASLQYSAGASCPLSDELVLARTYSDIMQCRFAERVSVQWNVPAELASARVPAFLLQPLLENAFEHGTRLDTNDTTHIDVHAERSGNVLRLSVTDTGPGFTSDDTETGIGLENTRNRLSALYGRGASLDIGSGRRGGTVVTATIPYAD